MASPGMYGHPVQLNSLSNRKKHTHPTTEIRIQSPFSIASSVLDEPAITRVSNIIDWYKNVGGYATAYLDFLSSKLLEKQGS